MTRTKEMVQEELRMVELTLKHYDNSEYQLVQDLEYCRHSIETCREKIKQLENELADATNHYEHN